MKQLSLFDGTQRYIVDKPLRLIELFAGYGSQSLALDYLGIPFESWRISEWAINSIKAYKDLHHAEDDTDYSKEMSTVQIQEWLCGRISTNYSEPMTRQQIFRKSDKKVRAIYNNMMACRNLGSITKIHGPDLAIEETDRYTYLLFYSFPCKDLSVAGNGAGCAKGSGTRSGLLWEVERILDELHAADRGGDNCLKFSSPRTCPHCSPRKTAPTSTSGCASWRASATTTTTKRSTPRTMASRKTATACLS